MEGLIFGGAYTRRDLFSEFFGISIKLNLTKTKLACGLGYASDGVHDPPLERINWNADLPQISSNVMINYIVASGTKQQIFT